LAPGQVHDANATLIADAVRELGLVAVPLGIAGDDEEALRRSLAEALDGCDAVLLSGGTSKGGGDLSYRVVEEAARVVVHGVALKPGKPLCLAEHEGRPVAVLPGFPTSAIFTFHTFVAPVLRRLHGEVETRPGSRRARLPWRIPSERGRAEFTLVSLVRGRGDLLAVPMGKGSGSVTSFARADGFFEIPADTEFAEEGDEVEVTLISPDLRPADLVVIGSHCTGLDVILGDLAARGLTAKVIHVGSRGGLEAARRGACDIAPMHLFDAITGSYNTPFVEEGTRLQIGYGRRQGLAYRPEHASLLGEDGDPSDVPGALCAAAVDPDLRIANRNPASGTRQLIEHLLAGVDGRPPGWSTSYRTHNAVAAAVSQGRSDYGVCLEGVARAAGLCWRPLADERYDFLIPDERWDQPGVAAFREALGRESVRAGLCEKGFEP
jgi:putative molybdopterin biosynthesis protein